MANSMTRQLLIAACNERGWRYQILGKDASILIIDDGHSRHTFMGSRPMQSSANGRHITLSKELTLEYVEQLGYTVPAYCLVKNEGLRAFLDTCKTIVIKPSDGGQSKGVTTGITSLTQAQEAVAYAERYSAGGMVIAQQQISGKLYRIFVLNGTVPVVTERRAAYVTGDGEQTVEQLIAVLNQDPRRGDGSDTPMKRVNLAKAKQYVGEVAFTAVPEAGQTVRIAAIESVSEGGEAWNVTSEVHETWKQAAIAITQSLGLFVAGFDVMSDKIHEPVDGHYLPLLEINSMPGLKIHEYPSSGEPVHLAGMILDEIHT